MELVSVRGSIRSNRPSQKRPWHWEQVVSVSFQPQFYFMAKCQYLGGLGGGVGHKMLELEQNSLENLKSYK